MIVRLILVFCLSVITFPRPRCERLSGCSNPLLKKLFKIMIDKKTNLCLAADNMTLEQTLKLLERVGPHICVLKIHARHLGYEPHPEESLRTLYECKKRYNFLLFEDAKFFDGQETVKWDYQTYFAKYVDIVTVVPDFGDSIFKAIEEGAKNVGLTDDEPRGCLAVCELSFANMVRPDFSHDLLAVAERNSPTCIGIIGQKLQVTDKNNMIKATPGVNLTSSGDGKNQQWRAPEKVLDDGADIIIVGRGITKAPECEWESLAIRYKELCFK